MFHKVLGVLLIVLCICALLALVYIITAKRYEDRVVGVNLVSTIALNIIAILSIRLDVNFIIDICVVYAMLGFTAVVVLCRLLALQIVEKGLKEKGGRTK